VIEGGEIATVSHASRTSYRTPSRLDPPLATTIALLAMCAIASLLLGTPRLGNGPGAFAGALSAVAVAIATTGLCVYARTNRSCFAVLVSPFGVAAATWIVLFIVRPLELYLFPSHATLALGQLGFDSTGLTSAVAVGGLGCAAWGLGYVAALGRQGHPRAPVRLRSTPHWLLPLGALAAGTLLWAALFVREGGVHALLSSAVSLRADQRSSAYGFIGVWLVQGTGLCALTVLLCCDRCRTRSLRLTLAIAAFLAAAAAVALQLRGLVVFALISALAIVVAVRRPRGSVLLAGAVVTAALVVVLAFAQQVRANTSRMTTADSVRTALRTPLWADFESDLGTFDNLVAMHSLVPASIPFLGGATIREVPEALVPRSLWPAKPLGIDSRVASYLYPGVDVAVPITVQGELYWNFDVAGVVLGALLLGVLFGAVGRLGFQAPGTGAFLVYVTVIPFTHAFLTRGLAVMTENLAFALIGVLLAAFVFGLRLRRPAPLGLRSEMPSTRPARLDADA
jgi:hypothetical protein